MERLVFGDFLEIQGVQKQDEVLSCHYLSVASEICLFFREHHKMYIHSISFLIHDGCLQNLLRYYRESIFEESVDMYFMAQLQILA